MDATRGVQEVSVSEAAQGGVEPAGVGGPLQFSRDAAISRIPAPHLLKQGQLQLAHACSMDDQPSQFNMMSSSGTDSEPSRNCWGSGGRLSCLLDLPRVARPEWSVELCSVVTG